VAAALLIAAAIGATTVAAPTPVRVVRIEAVGARDPERLRSVLGIQVGDPFSRLDIRRGVQALLASREVEDVTVTTEPVADGIALGVRVQVASRVDTVHIEGLKKRLRTRVRTTIALPPGIVLRLPELEERVARLAGQLRSDGYPGASLEPFLDFDLKAGTVSVTVRGELGPPRVLAGIECQGVVMSEEELLDVCGLKHGKRISDATAQRARRRLEAHLRRGGWWQATVASPEIVPGEGGSVVRLRARPGVRYRLELVGVKRSDAFDEKALPFLAGEEAFSGDPNDAASAVRRFLQRKKHLLATASATLSETREVTRLRIDVRLGPKLPITKVGFPGLQTVAPGKASEGVGVRKRNLTPWGREPVDDTTLAADAASVLAILRSEGFAEARVESPRIQVVDRGFHVDIPVVEGPRHTVAAVEVKGLPAGFKAPTLALAATGAWSASAEAEAQGALVGALRDAAFLDAWVESAHTCADARCTVTLTAHPGERTTVGRLIVAGLGRTRPDTVTRLAGLQVPSPIGAGRLVEAQRRLLSLGLFQQAALRPIPGQDSGDSQGYVIEIEEALTRSISWGLGWDSVAQGRVSFSWSQLNLGGRGHSLSFSTDLSRTEQNVELLYRAPKNLNFLGVPIWMAIYRGFEDRTDYQVERQGMWVEVGDRWRKPLRVVPRYDYSIVNSNAPPEVESDLEREDQDINISSITPILEWDTRDDPLMPHRGLYASLQPQFAFEAFGADAQFDKITLMLSGYAPAGRSVFAGALRVGGIHPRTPATADSTSTDNLQVPIAVRYFAGGRISNRAFPTDELGAPGTFSEDGAPIGGAGTAIANLELRFPVMGAVGGSVFVDGGNVWPSWRDVSTDEMRWGVGLGVRVETPMGPFRLEYGWKLDQREGESSGELFFSFGNPF
jgi:outer membrane protein insertion porin family